MTVKQVRLSEGAHVAPFDENGNATMCAQEYTSWLAGEEHSDRPGCVSPVLTTFAINLNDSLDDEKRQKMRPYLVRQIGTANDGQDEARSLLALDWLVRTYAPAFLAAAGLNEEADKLKGLAAIEGIETAKAAGPQVRSARAAVRAAAGDAAGDAAWAAAWAAVRAAAGDAAWAAAGDAAGDALRPTVDYLQADALRLLGEMIDPGGIHDAPSAELMAKDAAGISAP